MFTTLGRAALLHTSQLFKRGMWGWALWTKKTEVGGCGSECEVMQLRDVRENQRMLRMSAGCHATQQVSDIEMDAGY